MSATTTTTDPAAMVDAMSKGERSLLLYLETRAVDGCGKVDGRRMNMNDLRIANRWAQENFIRFTRLLSKYHDTNGPSHAVELSEAAWACAAEERKRHGRRVLSEEVVESLNHFEQLK